MVGALTVATARFRGMSREGIGNSPSGPLAIYQGEGDVGGGDKLRGATAIPSEWPLGVPLDSRSGTNGGLQVCLRMDAVRRCGLMDCR